MYSEFVQNSKAHLLVPLLIGLVQVAHIGKSGFHVTFEVLKNRANLRTNCTLCHVEQRITFHLVYCSTF